MLDQLGGGGGPGGVGGFFLSFHTVIVKLFYGPISATLVPIDVSEMVRDIQKTFIRI